MSAYVLKIIAVITMITDHSAAVFPTDISYILRSIGRIAFPIYVFLIAEGCRYTKDIWKYVYRLGLYALISEIPFDLCFNSGRNTARIDFLSNTNVFYTLCLGVLAVAEFNIIKSSLASNKIIAAFVYKIPFNNPDGTSSNTGFFNETKIHEFLLKSKTVLNNFMLILPALIPVLGCMLIADELGTDYGAKGVLLIFAIFICDTKLKKLICLSAGIVYLYGMGIVELAIRSLIDFNFAGLIRNFTYSKQSYLMFGFACISILLIFFYNGSRGRNIKKFFYVIYPLHLSILAVFKFLLK